MIVANIICDEDFDCNELLIAQDISNDTCLDSPPLYVGRGKGGEWEIVRYIFQNDIEVAVAKP